MKTKIIDYVEAQKDINRLCERATLNRRLRPISYSYLRQHGTQILAWAKAEKSSKRKVAILIQQKLGLSVSPDQAYRFVKIINEGNWPNSKKSKALPK